MGFKHKINKDKVVRQFFVKTEINKLILKYYININIIFKKTGLNMQLIRVSQLKIGDVIIFRLHPEMESIRDKVRNISVLNKNKVRIDFIGQNIISSGYVNRAPDSEVILKL